MFMAEQMEKETLVAKAKARFLRVPPRKARYVADMIRGMTVKEGLEQLAVIPRPSAVPAVKRLLKSAMSNVDPRLHLDEDNVLISAIRVDEGPTMKRIQPRAMGRAFRIRKRTCHIEIELTEL